MVSSIAVPKFRPSSQIAVFRIFLSPICPLLRSVDVFDLVVLNMKLLLKEDHDLQARENIENHYIPYSHQNLSCLKSGVDYS